MEFTYAISPVANEGYRAVHFSFSPFEERPPDRFFGGYVFSYLYFGDWPDAPPSAFKMPCYLYKSPQSQSLLTFACATPNGTTRKSGLIVCAYLGDVSSEYEFYVPATGVTPTEVERPLIALGQYVLDKGLDAAAHSLGGTWKIVRVENPLSRKTREGSLGRRIRS